MAVSSLVTLALACVLLLLDLFPPSRAPEAPDMGSRVASLDLARAASVLSEQARQAQRQTPAALFPGDEENQVQLFRLQADAAQVTLLNVRMVPLPREHLLEPVQATLELDGGYYDVPIFVDNLYRQSRVLTVRRLTLSGATPVSALVNVVVEAVLWRPARPPPSLFNSVVSGPGFDPTRQTFAVSALSDAFRLEAMESFNALVPELERRRSENRQVVLRNIPVLVRELAASPLGWAAAEFTSGQVRIVTEPGL